MYHPDLIAAREEAATRQFGVAFPGGTIPWYSARDSAALTASAMAAVDDEGAQVRPLTDDEQRFVSSARLRVIFDFPYFAERFCWIDQEGHGLRRLTPFWESQQLVLDQLGRREKANRDSGSPDRLLLNILQARQLGVSTLSEALVA